jgi:hypothetical protein
MAQSEVRVHKAEKENVVIIQLSLTNAVSFHLESPFSFRSPNLDKNPRFTAHIVKDVTKASPVDEGEIGKMTIVEPRKKPGGATTKMANAEPNEGINGPEDSSEEPKQPKKQQPKSQQPKKQQPVGTNKEDGKAITRNKGEAKILKDLYAKAFKQVTLTMGCLTGTMRRATSMDQDEVRIVADRINSAVHVMSMARMLIFKGVELFIYRQLADKPQPSDIMDVDAPEPSSTKVQPIHDMSKVEPESSMNPLDLLLDKKHGRTLVRNLGALIMKGRIDRGRGSKDPCGQKARALAKSIYEDLNQAVPGVLPLDPEAYETMHLGVPNADICVNVHTAIRTHFGRIPELVTTKVCF